ncbi:MAG: hypothetical protein MK089_02845 [Phycisphaerales bacterium]|nr:hypothetical protein [Phycisphaerales bacterium]
MPHHYVIHSPNPVTSQGMAPLGDRKTIIQQLGQMNTCPERDGEPYLYGPGIRLEIRQDEDPVRQILLSIVEEEIAWLVIERIATTFNWKIIDFESGDEIDFNLREDEM